ncbi:signal peptidase I [Enterococcus sp. S22(2020)]|uniref:signal peptidase I n=2 Tax=unclassified Enterococcus TaxID=2608891 RepID=UPI00298CA571|nr:signal peptidase I [Enterococcus sp. S22(2020)]
MKQPFQKKNRRSGKVMKKKSLSSPSTIKKISGNSAKQKRQRRIHSSKKHRNKRQIQKKRLLPTSNKKKQAHRKRKRVIKELFLAFFSGSILIVLVSFCFVRIVTVSGFGMVPTLREGDKVVTKKTSDLERFDLAVFTLGNEKIQVRRIIGMPGETIDYTSDTLYINEQPVDEKFLIDEVNESQKNGRNYTENFARKTVVIPEQYYFVMGDNRPYATDSRHYGFVAKKNIIGKVIVQLFPVNEFKIF